MTRAKTQGGGGKVPRAATQGGGKGKRPSTNSHSALFDDLEAAIDALDSDTSSPRHAAKPKSDPKADKAAAKPVPPPKRTAPGPTPPSEGAQIKLPPRTTPPKPPPGAERAAAIRARESRAQSEVGIIDEVEEIDSKPIISATPVRVPPRPPPGTRPPATRIPDPPKPRAADVDGLPPIKPPPSRRTPVPPILKSPGVAASAEANVDPARAATELARAGQAAKPAEAASTTPSAPTSTEAAATAPSPEHPGATSAPARPSPTTNPRSGAPSPVGDGSSPEAPRAPRAQRAEVEPVRSALGPPNSELVVRFDRPAAGKPLSLDLDDESGVRRDALSVLDLDESGVRRDPEESHARRTAASARAVSDALRSLDFEDGADDDNQRDFDDESGVREIESSGHSIDIDLEESQPAARAYDSGPVRRRPISEDARAISVGDTPDDDVVIEGEDLPAIQPLSIAILDDPPVIAAAKGAIAVAGHKVVAAASGQAGIEQIKSLLRSGSAEVLLVGVPGGEELIDTALALAPRRPVVIAATSGKAVEATRRAASVGADLAIARPIDVEKLAPVLFAASKLVVERQTATNARGNETMMRARLDALVDHEPGAMQPFELFQRVLELELKRSKRYGYPIAVALFSLGVNGLDDEPPPPGVHGILRARAGNALIHSIRDIDLATELDQERFLVLLPYTTLAGAAEVARRILHAVTSSNPINAAGKTLTPRITGAVSGAMPGQPLSFSRLMRDATQALEQARRDGAELAVPMIRDRGDQ